MREIPVQATPQQAFSVVLDELNVAIVIRTTQTGMYVDITADGVPLVTGRKAQDRTNLATSARFRGFPGLQLYFVDLQGDTNPVWSGLGERYVLLYGVPPQTDADTPGVYSVVGMTETLPNGSVVLTYSGTALYDGTYNFQ
jgi:hypothetical protein